MFLMKLQLNLFDELLAERFRVHPSTASRNFHCVLDVAAGATAFLIKCWKGFRLHPSEHPADIQEANIQLTNFENNLPITDQSEHCN